MSPPKAFDLTNKKATLGQTSQREMEFLMSFHIGSGIRLGISQGRVDKISQFSQSRQIG